MLKRDSIQVYRERKIVFLGYAFILSAKEDLTVDGEKEGVCVVW